MYSYNSYKRFTRIIGLGLTATAVMITGYTEQAAAVPFSITDDFAGGISAPWSLSSNIPAQVPNWNVAATANGAIVSYDAPTPGLNSFVTLNADRSLPGLTGAFSASASVRFERDATQPLLTSQGFRVALFDGADFLLFYQADGTRVSRTGDVTGVRLGFITFSDADLAFADSTFGSMTLTDFEISGEATITAVPEPGGLALFAIGLACLGFLGRRRYTTSSSRLVVSP